MLNGTDYFTVLGVPRKLILDPGDLERRFRTLSRQHHPDYFHNAPPAERRASLERSSYLNDAYRTLREIVTRIGYLLELEGVDTKGQGSQVPPALLEEVFALNEELDEVRALRMDGAPKAEWQVRLARARQPIETRRDEHEADLGALSAKWDALVDAGAPDEERRVVLAALRERMLERHYITNLLAGIERELTPVPPVA